jgi:hypothetical protein
MPQAPPDGQSDDVRREAVAGEWGGGDLGEAAATPLALEDPAVLAVATILCVGARPQL